MKNLPDLKKSNLDQVMTTIIDGLNSFITGVRENFKASKTNPAAYSLLIDNMFSMGENLGFATGIYYTCGLNIDDSLVGILESDKWKGWPFGRPGAKLEDLDTIGETWTLWADACMRLPDHMNCPSFEGMIVQKDMSSGVYPKFVELGRIKAAQIISTSISEHLKNLRIVFSTIESGKHPSKDAIALAFKELLLLRFLVGFVDGIAYSAPGAVTDLKIVVVSPKSTNEFAFATFITDFGDRAKKAGYYSKIANEICYQFTKQKGKR